MKVLILCHKNLTPPQHLKLSFKKADFQPWRTEFSVYQTLSMAGHQVQVCGLEDSFQPLKIALSKFRPDIVFNLLEEFDGERLLEPLIVSYLEQNQIPYTGCSAQGLLLAKNKLAAKVLLENAGVPVPINSQFPKFVKLIDEESSMGISQSSVVKDFTQLKKRVAYLKRRFGRPILIEDYIEGREFHIAVIGGPKREDYLVSDIWETTFGRTKGRPIISERVKWDFRYRDQQGISLVAVKDLSKNQCKMVKSLAIKACEALDVAGYARVDIRYAPQGQAYVLEVNPNPDICQGDEFALCASTLGFSYEELLQTILRIGMKHSKNLRVRREQLVSS